MDFNHRKMTGFVIEVSDEKPEGDYEIKSILKVIDKQDVINEELIRLSRDMSYLYKNSMGQCLSLMVPNAKRDTDAAPFFEEGDFSPIEALSPDQERVLREYHGKREEGKTLFYLYGVTGSGKSEVYYEHNNLVTVGRAINRTDVEDQAYVCVIDQDIAENLFAGENPVGKTLTLNGATYTVIGLEGENSDLMASMSGFGTSSDGTVTIPYTTARKITGQKNISSLEIYIENADYTDQLSDEVEGVLYQAFNQNEDSYFVFAMDSLLDTMNEMLSMLTYMLAGIASIALLVGGIGIMNMMLVSVSERKQEIGLRKAMGATPGRIQLQFLLESVVLSLIGGMRTFDMIWSMTKGGPGYDTDVLASAIYKQYAGGYYGLATAGNVIMLLMICVIAFPLYRYLLKKEEDYEVV